MKEDRYPRSSERIHFMATVKPEKLAFAYSVIGEVLPMRAQLESSSRYVTENLGSQNPFYRDVILPRHAGLVGCYAEAIAGGVTELGSLEAFARSIHEAYVGQDMPSFRANEAKERGDARVTLSLVLQTLNDGISVAPDAVVHEARGKLLNFAMRMRPALAAERVANKDWSPLVPTLEPLVQIFNLESPKEGQFNHSWGQINADWVRKMPPNQHIYAETLSRSLPAKDASIPASHEFLA